MRGLTLTAPWGTLIAIGAKRIETRSWATSYRGLVAIHQAKGLKPVGGRIGLQAICSDEPFRSAINPAIYEEREFKGERYPTWDLDRLPLGCIVAVATLTNCHRIPDVPRHFPRGVPDDHPHASYPVVLPPFSDTPELSFGNYAPGRYAWLLDDVRRLPEPIPHRGALSLWAVPAEVERRIAEQLGGAAT
jgi:activating signal cointegrator 1